MRKFFTVSGARWHQTTLLLRFEELTDRSAAESARGLLLHATVAADETPDDPDEFYDHQLVGLAARLTDGSPLGEITAVRHEGADLLVIRRRDGGEALVPFVTAIVPTVDLDGGFVVIDPPEGLLEL